MILFWTETVYGTIPCLHDWMYVYIYMPSPDQDPNRRTVPDPNPVEAIRAFEHMRIVLTFLS